MADVGDQPRFRYDARLANEIELRWQDHWEAAGTFAAPNPAGPLAAGFDQVAGRPKFMIMDMFPYPSGSGLHVGHPLGYIATDVYARYLRMTGHNVLHPFGYDAFGLPAEQYAIDTGQHPKATTERNIANMQRQLRRLGLGHDLRREFATTDPAYYKWTQWIFLQIFNSWFDREAGRARPIAELVAEFESGSRAPVSEANPGERPWAELGDTGRRKVVDSYRLAYISEELVNWCPGLGTVLANEEITVDGRSDIGNYPVYRRPLRQWMLRITAYAERLIRDLDHLDWPESDQDHAAELDRPQRRRQHRVPGGGPGWRGDPRVHHPARHAAGCHLPGAGARAPDGGRADRRRLAGRDPGGLAVPGGGDPGPASRRPRLPGPARHGSATGSAPRTLTARPASSPAHT